MLTVSISECWRYFLSVSPPFGVILGHVVRRRNGGLLSFGISAPALAASTGSRPCSAALAGQADQPARGPGRGPRRRAR